MEKSVFLSWYNSLKPDILVDKPWLFIHGIVGDWKTSIAVCLSRYLISQSKQKRISGSLNYYFCNCSELMDTLRDFHTGHQEYWDDLKTCGLLVIDDFGSETGSIFVFNKLYQLINYRYQANPMLTLITSNYSIIGIGERVLQLAEINKKKTGVDECEEYEAIANRIIRRLLNQSVEIHFK